MNQSKCRQAIAAGRFEWRQHTLERLVERQICQDDVLQVILEGEMIETYPEDKPFSSGLFFAMPGGSPLHAVVAHDENSDWVYIVTAYPPDLEHFESDYKTRRKQ